MLATELEATCASLKNEAQGARERLARLEKRLLAAERARVRAETAVRRDVAGAEVGVGCVHVSVFRADVRGRWDSSGVERIFVRVHVLHASVIDLVWVLLHALICMCTGTCICKCTHAYIYVHLSMYRRIFMYVCMRMADAR